MSKRNFVYFYSSSAGKAMYVGYGNTAQRALSHSGGSHNKRLKSWLKKGDFNLRIAGPYASEKEAKAVEAALISSINPLFN
ncbi:MAG: GIY-YIG nuclease family protein, partial [Gammaproteobacteria bacterium]